MTLTEADFLASFPQIDPDAQPGYPGHLTDEQQAVLEEFRKIVHDEGYKERTDDATLLRFLRARKFDVAKAKDMYAACEKWREEYGVNTILTDFHYEEKEKVAQLYPQYYHKVDKDGRPIYIEELGAVKVDQLYKLTSQERMIRNLVWEYEAFVKHRLSASSRMHNKLVETSCTILDLKGISLSTASQVYSYIRETSHIGQDYYPERMGLFYLINAPFGFSTIFSVIKRFLDPVTVTKIYVLGSKYQSELLKQISPENLPEKFGGQSVTEGPLELADAGPWRDPQYVGPEGMAPRPGTEVASQKTNDATQPASTQPIV